MKRRDFVRHLEKNGCEFFRDGINPSDADRG